MRKKKPTIWEGCYESSWKGTITAEAFAHPAKFSRDLIERIFDHMLAKGWIRKGDRVGDCFGGIGTGGITAAYRGLQWVGVELEPKFVALAEANFELHRERWERLGDLVRSYPFPVVIKGDSRKFHELVGPRDAVVTSPPFARQQSGGGIVYQEDRQTVGRMNAGYQNQGETNGQIGNLKDGAVDGVITSPPFRDARSDTTKCVKTRGGGPCAERHHTVQAGAGYGESDGQIDNLKTGEVQAVVCSPPYSDISSGAGGLNTKPAKHVGQQSGRSASAASQDTDQRYGQEEGQIARLKGGDVDALVTSPPYADSIDRKSGIDPDKVKKPGGPNSNTHHDIYGKEVGQIGRLHGSTVDSVVTSPPWESNCEGVKKASKFKDPAAFANNGKGHGASPEAKLASMQREEERASYGDSPGNIGKEKAETYWEAMLQVYRSCFLAIKPGGYMAVVVKDYVKDKKRVPLCDNTVRLLEHIGFQTVERVHAMLVKETEHADLFNGTTKETKSRKSFFRRLCESKGSPEINWEEVIFVQKPC